jgi:transcriptional regulator with XRE-family HTH domain
MKIGERIKQRREELELSQEELARRLGYKSRSSINKIENDASGLPQTKIVAIANALRTTPSYIMGWQEEQQKNDTISDAVIRMRTDEEFMSVVDCLLSLETEKISIVKQLILTFQK